VQFVHSCSVHVCVHSSYRKLMFVCTRLQHKLQWKCVRLGNYWLGSNSRERLGHNRDGGVCELVMCILYGNGWLNNLLARREE